MESSHDREQWIRTLVSHAVLLQDEHEIQPLKRSHSVRNLRDLAPVKEIGKDKVETLGHKFKYCVFPKAGNCEVCL